MNIDNDQSIQLKSRQQQCYEVIKQLRLVAKSMVEQNTTSNNHVELVMKLKDVTMGVDDIISSQETTLEDKRVRNDKLNDRYQSLCYEKDIYQSEINHLQQSMTFPPDSSTLNISLTNSFTNQEDSNKIIERLEFEMSQRIDKLNELEECKQKNKKAKDLLFKKKKELGVFESKLKTNNITLQNVMKPLQAHISVLAKPNPINPIISYAPQPLYTLYHELQSFKNYFYDKLNVEIICKTDIEELYKTMYHNQLVEEIEPNTCQLLTSSSPHFKSQVLTPSPISLQVIIPSQSGSSTLVMEFYYYQSLKIVTVRPVLNNNEDHGQQLLETINENDKGLFTPNSSNHYLFESEPFLLSEYKLIGRPFKWAQYITGLSFLPELTMDNSIYSIDDFKPKTTNQILSEIISKIK